MSDRVPVPPGGWPLEDRRTRRRRDRGAEERAALEAEAEAERCPKCGLSYDLVMAPWGCPHCGEVPESHSAT